jgi:hypothetical protein
VTVRDLSATRDTSDISSREYDISQLQQIEAPAERRFRFARIPLRDDAPMSLPGRNGLSQQIGETLWQFLYPDLQGAKPHDFAEQHLVVGLRCVGVWGDRGVAIAHKPKAGSTAAPSGNASAEDDSGTEQDFIKIVALARGIDQLIAEGAGLTEVASKRADLQSNENADGAPNLAEVIAARGEILARSAAQIKHNLTLPNSELLRRFYDATGIDELLATLRDLNQTAAEYLRREKMEEQARRQAESTETVAEVQSKLEWVEVFIVGVYAVETIELFAKHVVGERSRTATLVILASLPVFLLFTTFVLQPWKRKSAEKRGRLERPAWILVVVIAASILGIIWAAWSLYHGPPPAG